MKSYWLGVLSGVGLLCLMGLTQVNTNFSNQGSLYNEFSNIYQNVQPKQFTLFSTTPTLNSLKDREIVIVSTGTVSLFTRIGDSTYSLTMERK